MNDVHIDYYADVPAEDGVPLVVVHTFGDRVEKLWQALKDRGCRRIALAAILAEDWERDLSPWPAKKVFKGGNDFGDGADAYIEKLTGGFLPEIRSHIGISEGPCYIAGYSFSGLFALYSLYKTTVFDGAASVSGSLWFPGFAEYAMSHEMQRKPERLYLSLGDKESSTRNEVMRTVGEKTELLYRFYRDTGIDCVFEMNPGNHFQDPEERLAKGIGSLLSGGEKVISI